MHFVGENDEIISYSVYTGREQGKGQDSVYY